MVWLMDCPGCSQALYLMIHVGPIKLAMFFDSLILCSLSIIYYDLFAVLLLIKSSWLNSLFFLTFAHMRVWISVINFFSLGRWLTSFQSEKLRYTSVWEAASLHIVCFWWSTQLSTDSTVHITGGSFIGELSEKRLHKHLLNLQSY